MQRVLIVANQTLADAPLADALAAACVASGECRFHIVVPATRPEDHLTWTEGAARSIAARRLDRAIALVRSWGADVDGEVGDASPVVAAADALRRDHYDEIIVSTFPLGISRWLKMDLPRRLERLFDIPVRHVVAPTRSRSVDDAA